MREKTVNVGGDKKSYKLLEWWGDVPQEYRIGTNLAKPMQIKVNQSNIDNDKKMADFISTTALPLL